MNFVKWMSAAVCGAVMALAGPAQAATYIITYTGHVTSGYDLTGVFGSRETDLSGLAYKAIYTLIDPTLGAIYYEDAITSNVAGGEGMGSAGSGSPLSAQFELAGVTKQISGAYFGFVQQGNGVATVNGPGDVINHSVTEIYENSDGTYKRLYQMNHDLWSYTNNIVNSPNYRDGLNYTVTAEDIGEGDFIFRVADNMQNPSVTEFAYGGLTIDVITISRALAGGVPEPATWAMMILGFGAIGGAMRGRVRRGVPVRFA